MEAQVTECAVDPTIRELTVSLFAGLGQNDVRGQIQVVTQWVMDNVSYVRDPIDGEYLVSPTKMIADYYQQGFMVGDCDDHVMLLNSMLGTIGINTKCAGVKFGSSSEYNHVISLVQCCGTWLQIDPCAKSGIQRNYSDLLTV